MSSSNLESQLMELADQALGQTLDRAADRWPRRTAVLWQDRRLTYEELAHRCRRFSWGLMAMNLGRGAVVGQMCAKRPEVIESFLGAAMAAGCVLPLCPKFRFEDLCELAGLAQVRVILADAEHIELARQLARAVGQVRLVGVGEVPLRSGEVGYEQLLGALPAEPAPPPHPDEVVFLNCTSGSTGVAKVCPTPHRVVQWNTIASISAHGVTGEDTYMGAFAVYAHPHELFIRSVPVGGTMVLDEGLRPRRSVELLARHRVRAVLAVPSFWRGVATAAAQAGVRLPDLWLLECGGGAVSAGLVADVYQALGKHLTPVWGSTETCGIALAMPVGEVPRPGVLGKPIRHYRVEVVDEQGRPLAVDEVGEMRISGPGVCQRYLDPRDTAETFRDGCFYTGDLVRMDAQGYVHFVGRRKNMLKMGGMRVYPEKIERVLEAHEAVHEAAVVPAPDERHGQIAVAFVVPREGVSLRAEDVVRICRAGLADFEVPRRVLLKGTLPKLATGKVDRQALMDEAAAVAGRRPPPA